MDEIKPLVEMPKVNLQTTLQKDKMISKAEMLPECDPEELKEIETESYIRPPSRMIQVFTRFYIEQGFENGSEAARKAGTRSKNANHIAYQWLQMPWVKKEVERAKELLGKNVNPLDLIAEQDVTLRLIRVYDKAMDKDRFSDAVKAVELMGRQIGMFTQKTETTKNVNNLSITARIEKDEENEKINSLMNILTEAKRAKNHGTTVIIDVKPEEKVIVTTDDSKLDLEGNIITEN